jgi:hypothetical protein
MLDDIVISCAMLHLVVNNCMRRAQSLVTKFNKISMFDFRFSVFRKFSILTLSRVSATVEDRLVRNHKWEVLLHGGGTLPITDEDMVGSLHL